MSDKPQLPDAFLDRMGSLLGGERSAFRAALDRSAPVAVRMNPFKPGIPPGDASSVPWCAAGYYLAERPKFPLDPLWHAGAYYVQDASSMFIEQLWRAMELPDDPLVLDACAAPGGKSTHLLSLLQGRGLLIANELVPKRNRILVENIMKWGCANQIVLESRMGSLTEACRPLGGFDVVLVDAPCSGEGLFRKDAEAIREWSPEHVASCARRQSLLLADAQQLVRPGGYLVYATCTWAPEEDERQVEDLLSGGEWEPDGPEELSFEGIVPGRAGLGWRFYPHRVAGEGFYCALLRKKGGSAGARDHVLRKTGDKAAGETDLAAWADLADLAAIGEGSHIHLFPEAFRDTLELLRRHDRGRAVRYFGIPAGASLHGEFKPFHSLALSTAVSGALPAIDVDRDAALAYLRKEAPAYRTDLIPGWNLVRYKGITLGWAKVLARRINNYYPKPWSIRP